MTYDVKFVGDHQFLILSWRDGHTHIYRYTFNAANPLATLAQLANQVESGDYDVVSIKAADETAQTLWYLSNEGDPRVQQIWAVQLDGSGSVSSPRSAAFTTPFFPTTAAPLSIPAPASSPLPTSLLAFHASVF